MIDDFVLELMSTRSTQEASTMDRTASNGFEGIAHRCNLSIAIRKEFILDDMHSAIAGPDQADGNPVAGWRLRRPTRQIERSGAGHRGLDQEAAPGNRANRSHGSATNMSSSNLQYLR